MTIERFMLDGHRDPEVYEQLTRSDLFPLVRDMEFKFGLKVLKKGTLRGVGSGNSRDSWVLAHKNGFAIGEVYVDQVWDPRKSTHVDSFMYYTPYYSKDRGRSSAERNTIQSKKMSSLITAISKYSAVPTMQRHTLTFVNRTPEAAKLMMRSLGNDAKHHDLTPSEVQGLLSAYLGESTNENSAYLDKNKCQNILDKYKEADKIMEQKKTEVVRAFSNPFYIIAVDRQGEVLVGKAAFPDIQLDGGSHSGVKTGEPIIVRDFKRYKSIEEVGDGSLTALSTMIKVSYENKASTTISGFPITDKYDADLDVAFYYRTSLSIYDHLWMVIPCST